MQLGTRIDLEWQRSGVKEMGIRLGKYGEKTWSYSNSEGLGASGLVISFPQFLVSQ